MNKETIEEAAEKHSKKMWGVYFDDIHPDVAITKTQGEISIQDFISGVKWEQDNNYENLKDAYFSAIESTGEGWNGEYAGGNNPCIKEKFEEGFNTWYENFKKK